MGAGIPGAKSGGTQSTTDSRHTKTLSLAQSCLFLPRFSTNFTYKSVFGPKEEEDATTLMFLQLLSLAAQRLLADSA